MQGFSLCDWWCLKSLRNAHFHMGGRKMVFQQLHGERCTKVAPERACLAALLVVENI